MQGKQRLDHIHGLRGIAALAVVLQHALQTVQDSGAGYLHPLLDNVNLGRFGVVLFFLISGLVVPFSFRGQNPVRHFVVSRFFRLYPAYWLSIPMLLATPTVLGNTLGPIELLANATMLQSIFGVDDLGPGYWSLRYELFFYSLCLMLFACRRLGDPILNGILVGGSLFFAALPVLANLLGADKPMNTNHFFVSVFFLGMLLRRSFVDSCPVAKRCAMVLVPLTVLTGFLLSGLFVPVPDNGSTYFKPMALGVAMAMPTVVLVFALWWKPRFPSAVMALGTISYSLYLFQDVGLRLMPYVLSPGQFPVIYVTAVIGVSIVTATAVYHGVEKPMIAVGKRLAAPRPTTSPATT